MSTYDTDGNRRLILTAVTWNELKRIQNEGNKVVWTEDMTVWNVSERWEFPVDRGSKKLEDCDGITLYKMDLLLKANFPADPLLFAICKDETGGGHAVLCVTTDRGDFILDNRHDEIKSYDELKASGYKFLYRSQVGGKMTDLWDVIKDHRA